MEPGQHRRPRDDDADASSARGANGGTGARGSSRAASDQLLDLQRRLAQAQRVAALGAVVARLAHELGTPLHSIAGHVDMMLADPAFPDSLRDRGRIVASEVRRLSKLIRGYLRRLRAPDPERTETDLNALVERTIGVLEPLLAARAVELELDLDPHARTPFPCDPDQVEQAVVNLVQNALDAMPQGGGLVVRTAVTDAGRAISVCDSGRGIAAEHLGHVFDAFYTTKEADRGSGLGLAICREIAHSHGGDILLDSNPELGTVVTLTLAAPVDGGSVA